MLEYVPCHPVGPRCCCDLSQLRCADAEAVFAVHSGKAVTPAIALDSLPEVEQQRLIVKDLLYTFTGSVSEYAQVTPVTGAGGNLHIVYSLTSHCDCCSPLVKETAAKCAPATAVCRHGLRRTVL